MSFAGKVGSIVKIENLSNATHLNGKTGLVMEFNDEKKRYVVMLLNGEKKRVRDKNLTLDDPTWEKINETELGNVRHCGKLAWALAGYPAEHQEIQPGCLLQLCLYIMKSPVDGTEFVINCSSADHIVFVDVVHLEKSKKEVYARIFQCNFESFNAREGLAFVRWLSEKELKAFIEGLREFEKFVSKIGRKTALRIGLSSRSECLDWLKKELEQSRQFEHIHEQSGDFVIKHLDGTQVLRVDANSFEMTKKMSMSNFHCFSKSLFMKAVGQWFSPWGVLPSFDNRSPCGEPPSFDHR